MPLGTGIPGPSVVGSELEAKHPLLCRGTREVCRYQEVPSPTAWEPCCACTVGRSWLGSPLLTQDHARWSRNLAVLLGLSGKCV